MTNTSTKMLLLCFVFALLAVKPTTQASMLDDWNTAAEANHLFGKTVPSLPSGFTRVEYQGLSRVLQYSFKLSFNGS
jgi:hypothetical protein